MSDRSEARDAYEDGYLPGRMIHVVSLEARRNEGEVDEAEISGLCKSFDLNVHDALCVFCLNEDDGIVRYLDSRFKINDNYDPDSEAGPIPEDVLRDMQIEGIA